MHEIGAHKVAHLAGFSFNLDTLYMTWISMAIVIVIAILATRNLKLVPQGWQNILEIIITSLLEQIDMAMGPRGRKIAPLLITLSACFLNSASDSWLLNMSDIFSSE